MLEDKKNISREVGKKQPAIGNNLNTSCGADSPICPVNLVKCRFLSNFHHRNICFWNNLQRGFLHTITTILVCGNALLHCISYLVSARKLIVFDVADKKTSNTPASPARREAFDALKKRSPDLIGMTIFKARVTSA